MASYGYDEERDRSSPETELRIHGIGGSTPELLLRDRDPIQVGGDEVAGFYRRRDESVFTEAYAWGGLTARANVRAFWILLLPFALVNVAGWMIAPLGRGGRNGPEAVVRAVALGSTVAMVGLVAAASVDLVVLQCGLQEACAEQSVWLRWLRAGALLDRPTRLVVVGLVPPVLALAVLSRLGRRTRERYEERFQLDPVPPSSVGNRLAQPEFWESTERVEALARLHVSASLFALAASAEWYFFRVERYQQGVFGEFEGPWTQWFDGPQVAGVAAVALLVATLGVVLHPSDDVQRRWAPRAVRTAIVVFAVVVVDGLRRDDRLGPAACPRSLEDLGLSDCAQLSGTWFAGFTWSMVFVPVLLLLLVLLGWGVADWFAAHRDEPAEAPVMFGTGPSVAVVTGLIVLTSTLAGTAIWLAELLGNRPTPNASPPYIRVFSDWDLVSLGLVLYLLTLLLWVLQRSIRVRYPPAARARRIDEIDAEYLAAWGSEPRRPRSSERRRWLEEIDTHRQIRTSWMPVLVQPLGLGVVVAIGIAIGYLLDREIWDGNVFLRYVFVDGHAWTELLLTISRWLILTLPGVAVLLLWRSFRNPDIRRNVGTLWDVLTFWPRWFHPFAPPAYPARAVPELVVRLQKRLTRHGPVVLSAHSQGSVIAVSAILALGGRADLDPAAPAPLATGSGRDAAGGPAEPSTEQRAARETLAKLALVTHGSPLSSLYGRFFPRYFGRDRLEEASRLLGNEDGTIRWRNLYRCTDPIGLPLFSVDRCVDAAGPAAPDGAAPDGAAPDGAAPDGAEPAAPDEIDVLLHDPGHEPPAPGDPFPPVRGHSNYYLEPGYRRAVEAMLTTLSDPPRRPADRPGEPGRRSNRG